MPIGYDLYLGANKQTPDFQSDPLSLVRCGPIMPYARNFSKSFKGSRIRNMDQTLPLFGQNTNRTNYFRGMESFYKRRNERRTLPNSEFKIQIAISPPPI